MLRHFIEIAAQATEIAGVLVIVGGLVFATARYAFVRAGDGLLRYKGYRHDLGRASVVVLGIIVVIRTFLSWSLALELDGRWPWQRGSSPS
jgi:uncharacterized membrane protein